MQGLCTLQQLFLILNCQTPECVIFPERYEKYKSYLDKDEKILVRGNLNVVDETAAKLIVQSIQLMDFNESHYTNVWIKFKDVSTYDYYFPSLEKWALANSGECQVKVYIENIKSKKELSLKIKSSDQSISYLEKLFGKDAVKWS